MIHMIKSFSLVSKAEVDVFLEFSYFFNDPTDVGNFTSVLFSVLLFILLLYMGYKTDYLEKSKNTNEKIFRINERIQ